MVSEQGFSERFRDDIVSFRKWTPETPWFFRNHSEIIPISIPKIHSEMISDQRSERFWNAFGSAFRKRSDPLSD